MKNKISAVKTRKNNVTSPQIPFVTTVQNIIYDNNYNVNDILGIIKINTEGSIKQQLDNLDNKIDNASLHLTDEIKQQIMQAVCDAYPAAEDIRFITIYDENMVVQNGILIHQSEDFNIIQNGIYDITTKSKINVNIQPSFQSKTTTENGLIIPDEGYDGLSGVTVNVPIETHLQSSKTVTTNGSVVPDSGYNGLLEVIVNVQPTFQSKIITKNGTYAPDEGYNGISNITINVRDDITTMPLVITQNGIYRANDENVDAFDEITVAVPNSYTADDENKVVQYGELTQQINRGTVRQNGIYDTSYNDSIEVDVDGSPAVLDTLTVTKNGFFLPKYGYDGFSSVIVNVPNSFTGDDNGKVVYNGTLVKQTSRTVTENGTYDTTLNNELKVKVPGSTGSAKHDGTPNTADGNKPGGAGSAVTGKDPVTGNDAVIGVDENGNLVNTFLPSNIVLTTNPTKMRYEDGENIDLSGAIIVAKKADGTTWTNVNYPNGQISIGEIVYTPMIAHKDFSQSEQQIEVGQEWTADSSYIVDTAGTWLAKVNDRDFYKENNGKAIAIFLPGGINRWYGPILISTDRAAIETTQGEAVSTFEYNGLTWYYNHGWHYQNAVYSTSLRLVTQTFANHEELFNWIMQTANVRTKNNSQTINLKWARPGDGKILSTTMNILVEPPSEENNN